MTYSHELPNWSGHKRRTPDDIPERVNTGGFTPWSTDKFKRGVGRGIAEERESNAKLGRLRIIHPDIQISPRSLEDGSFLSAFQYDERFPLRLAHYQERDLAIPKPSDDPLIYLEKYEIITFAAAEVIASRELPKVGIEGAGPIDDVLRADFQKDMINPKGFDENGIPNYMVFLPPFESEVFQRLLAAQFAKRCMLDLAKTRGNYGCAEVVEKDRPDKRGVKRIVFFHESPRKIGYNDHVLLRYLTAAFRLNLSIVGKQDKLTEQESEMFAHIMKWGRETAVGYDTRGDNLRGRLMRSATQWLVPTEQLLS